MLVKNNPDIDLNLNNPLSFPQEQQGEIQHQDLLLLALLFYLLMHIPFYLIQHLGILPL